MLSDRVIHGIRPFLGIGWVLDEADHVVRDKTAACCWTVRAKEEGDIWGLTVGGKQGVAIRTTWSRLQRSLEGEARDLRAGLVEYVDPHGHDVPPLSVFRPFFLKKSISYRHEQELRLIATDWPEQKSAIQEHGGISIGVDVKELIERVIVHPGADDAFLAKVEDLCARGGLDVPVDRSELDVVTTR